jgi:hypothetical protein
VPLCTNRARAIARQLRVRPESCATIPPAAAYPAFVFAAAHARPICLRFPVTFIICAQSGSRVERMEEKRKHPRTEIDEPAYVSSGGSVMRCVVRNISPEGAAIDVENPAFVPQRFRLVMAKDSSIVRECRVAWIKQNRIGLTFMEVAPEPSK